MNGRSSLQLCDGLRPRQVCSHLVLEGRTGVSNQHRESAQAHRLQVMLKANLKVLHHTWARATHNTLWLRRRRLTKSMQMPHQKKVVKGAGPSNATCTGTTIATYSKATVVVVSHPSSKDTREGTMPLEDPQIPANARLDCCSKGAFVRSQVCGFSYWMHCGFHHCW